MHRGECRGLRPAGFGGYFFHMLADINELYIGPGLGIRVEGLELGDQNCDCGV
jgi:hypothetical protein